MSTTNKPETKLAKAVDMITNDQELGKQAPGAPFAIVSLSYVAVLFLCAIVLAAFVWLYQ